MKRFILNLFLLICLTSGLLAQGDLLVNPVRVVFEGAKLNEDINLTNIGSDTAVYVINFQHYKMLEDGNFTPNPVKDSLCADPLLRLFPRKVKLAPEESQTIRLQLRKPLNLTPGEYRSHIYFRAEKTQPKGFDMRPNDSLRMAVRITPVFGISIPVFVQHGDLQVNATLSDINIEAVNDTVSMLKMLINRSGTKSAFGNIIVEYVPEKGAKTEIAKVNGVAVYPEISKRWFSLPLRMTNQMKLSNAKLRIKYTVPGTGTEKIITQADFPLRPVTSNNQTN